MGFVREESEFGDQCPEHFYNNEIFCRLLLSSQHIYTITEQWNPSVNQFSGFLCFMLANLYFFSYGPPAILYWTFPTSSATLSAYAPSN